MYVIDNMLRIRWIFLGPNMLFQIGWSSPSLCQLVNPDPKWGTWESCCPKWHGNFTVCYCLMDHRPIEIVDLPIKNDDFSQFALFVKHHQNCCAAPGRRLHDLAHVITEMFHLEKSWDKHPDKPPMNRCRISSIHSINWIQSLYMEVSWNGGIPKLMVYNGEPYKNGWSGDPHMIQI